MEKLNEKITLTKKAIKTIDSLINENIKDIGKDTTSKYSLMRLEQNVNLLFAKQQLEQMLDMYNYTE